MRFKRTYAHTTRYNGQAPKILLEKVWGLNGDRRLGNDAYISHYLNLLQVHDLLVTRLNDFDEYSKVVELIDLVRNNVNLTLSEIINAIQKASRKWCSTAFDDAAARSALELAIRLWLFRIPSLEDLSWTLSEVLKQHHPSKPVPSWSPAQYADVQMLSADFSAKSLTRKGGFYMVWTSDLADHLTFASKNQLRVFRHAQVLRTYQYGIERQVPASLILLKMH